MGKEWDSFKETGKSKYFHSPDKETERGFGARDFGTPIKALPRFAIDSKVYQDWCYEWAVEVFRVLKPGAHLLAFSGCRTYHRLACAIEDAGFEIRDMVEWFYGSGFPKGQNISKAIDRLHPRIGMFDKFARHYAERRKLSGLTHAQICEEGKFYDKINHGGASSNWEMGLNIPTIKQWKTVQPLLGLSLEYLPLIKRIEEERQIVGKREGPIWGDTEIGRWRTGSAELDVTIPATDEARQWQGWNTQLKPAHEPIVFARKPISEKSIVENVLIHGTGAINEGACRIAVSPDVDAIGKTTTRTDRKKAEVFSEDSCGFDQAGNPVAGVLPTGRYPANLILSHHPDCKMIQVGVTKVKDVSTHAQSQKLGKHGIYGDYEVSLNTRHSFDVTNPEVWQCVEGCPVRILNEQSGDTKYAITDKLDHVDSKIPILGSKDIYGLFEAPRIVQRYGGSGGAARFFYCAKPSVAERNQGIKNRLYILKEDTPQGIAEEIQKHLEEQRCQ